MPRRPLKPRQKRPPPPPDIKYNSVLVQRFINKVMWDGKKTLAQRIVYKAFDILSEKPISTKLEAIISETGDKTIKEKLQQMLLLHIRKGRSLIQQIKDFINSTPTIPKDIQQKLQSLLNEKTYNPLEVFTQAVENARPLLEVKPRRVGGATFQVPVEVEKYRGETLAMRWMIQQIREKEGKPAFARLADEILLAYRKEGPVIKKREELHKMAEANRAFAHFRW